MNRDHRDSGSSLTMSVLLSPPDSFHGGRFLTWDCGGANDGRGARLRAWTDDDAPTEHELCRGDGILFRSEDLHNVAPVTDGLRHALVIELWAKPPNNINRYR